MKTIRMIHTALILMVLAFISACSTDSADPIQGDSGGDNPGDKITVHMTLSTAPSSGTRATLSWENGIDAENMKSWVVAFVKDNKVVSLAENKNVSDGNRIKDDVAITDLPKENATYQVYSFANLTAAELGISKGTEVHFDNMKWKMNGNGFNVNATDCKGIPMSNKQEVTVDASGKTDKNELWVVRMLAKVTLQFRNPSSTPLEINDITLSDVTSNPSADVNTDGNIMLLPKHSDASGTSGAPGSSSLTGADKDEVTCIPNLVEQAATENYTYKLSPTVTIPAGTTDYKEISFYVNESAAGNTSKYFIINLNTSAGVKRYALFQDWTTIARNDHHILPISLDDYKLKFDVQSFTAIGLYPSITDNGTTLSYTCYYPEEEFHIQPKVVHADDTDVSGTIDYTKVKWELIQEDDMADAAAATANAQKVFKGLPSWDKTTGYFEGIFNDDKADKKSALYQVTVPVPGVTGKSLTYKILFTKDLSSFAARKHYTRKYYRYE